MSLQARGRNRDWSPGGGVYGFVRLLGLVACAAAVVVGWRASAVGQCGPAPVDCYTYRCDANTLEWVQSGVKSIGTTCSDGNACTSGDKCDGSGGCRGTLNPAIDDRNLCTQDACNASTGAITHTALTTPCCTAGVQKPVDALCNDSNACTAGERCTATATCTGGTPVPVDDANPCTADSCDPLLGVQHGPNPVDLPCCQGTAVATNDCCAAGAPKVDAGRAACTYPCFDSVGRMTSRTVCLAGQTCGATCP